MYFTELAERVEYGKYVIGQPFCIFLRSGRAHREVLTGARATGFAAPSPIRVVVKLCFLLCCFCFVCFLICFLFDIYIYIHIYIYIYTCCSLPSPFGLLRRRPCDRDPFSQLPFTVYNIGLDIIGLDRKG